MSSKIKYHRPSRLGSTEASYRKSETRKETNNFYASTRWRKLRSAFLAEHPLCEECKRGGRVKAAIDVHHKLERRDHPEQSFERENLEALCKRCHNAKRAH